MKPTKRLAGKGSPGQGASREEESVARGAPCRAARSPTAELPGFHPLTLRKQTRRFSQTWTRTRVTASQGLTHSPKAEGLRKRTCCS